VSQYANPSQQGKNKRKARKKTERERERDVITRGVCKCVEVLKGVWRAEEGRGYNNIGKGKEGTANPS
jgi:hypothetical protein